MHIAPLGNSLLGLYSTPEDGFIREDSRLTQVVNKLTRRFGIDAESFLTSDMKHKERQLVMQIRNNGWHDIAREIRACGIFATCDIPDTKPQQSLKRDESVMSPSDFILSYCDRVQQDALNIDLQNLRFLATSTDMKITIESDEVTSEVIPLNDGIPGKGNVYLGSNDWWDMQSDAWKQRYPMLCRDGSVFLIKEIVSLEVVDLENIRISSRKILVSFK